MAQKIVIRELITRLGIQTDLNQLDRFERSLNGTIGTVRKLIGVFTGASVITGLFLRLPGQFEQTTIAFETLLGSADQAKETLKELQVLASKTPFQFTEIADLTKRLIAFGFGADQLTDTITTIGNIASGVGRDKLPQLVLALGQVRTATKLRGQELRQFTEAGVPLIEALADLKGIDQSQIAGLISAGGVSFDDVNNALLKLTRGNGRFANLMEKQSKTFFGILSNIKDIIDIISIQAAGPLLKSIKENARVLADYLTVNQKLLASGVSDFFQGVAAFAKRLGFVIGRLLVFVNRIVQGFGGWEKVLNAVGIALSLLLGIQFLNLVGGAVIAVFNLVKAFKLLRVGILATNAAALIVPILIGAAVAAILLAIEDIIAFFNGEESITGNFVDLFKNGFDNVVQFFENMYNKIINSALRLGSNLVSAIVDPITTAFDAALSYIQTSINLISNKVSSFFEGGVIGSIIKTAGDFLDSNPANIGNAPGQSASFSDVSTSASQSSNNKFGDINITVPPTTNPEQVSEQVQFGLTEALDDILGFTQNQIQTPILE